MRFAVTNATNDKLKCQNSLEQANRNNLSEISGYSYAHAGLSPSHAYLLPTVLAALESFPLNSDDRRIFEVGCGNGSVANELHQRGYEVIGIDPSEQGITYATGCYPHIRLYQGSSYDDLHKTYGQFPIVISLEVIEHLYFPRRFANTVFNLVSSGGAAIISTPYHGYWKNLALAISGQMDRHFTALWDHGHIKFWSNKTLTVLLREAGFSEISFFRVGRVPFLAKSMIAIARKK
jgi:2-polyprenyl-6-hydroxyphenyl methylase/3-demethylubiquinone-9 3-methyltransferase